MLRRNALSGMLYHAIDFNLSGVFPVNQQLGINRDMADPVIPGDQILELFFGYWRCAAGNDQNRAALAVRCQARGRAAPRFAHQAATNRQPFGKGPRIDGQHVPVQGHYRPGDGIDIVDGYRIDHYHPHAALLLLLQILLDLPFAFHHRRQRDMPDLMMGLRRQQSRHPRLGDRGTYIASHIGPRQGYRINHRVTADENTP